MWVDLLTSKVTLSGQSGTKDISENWIKTNELYIFKNMKSEGRIGFRHILINGPA